MDLFLVFCTFMVRLLYIQRTKKINPAEVKSLVTQCVLDLAAKPNVYNAKSKSIKNLGHEK